MRNGWRGEMLSRMLSAVSHGLMLRDRLLRVTSKLPRSAKREEIAFANGDRRLAGVWVQGVAGGPVLLICHGIGETVEHWSALQAWMGERGVTTMVFNYSGYGRSTGPVSVENCDEDFVSAYTEVRRRVGDEARVFVLGFSLGSGIVAQGAGALRPVVAGVFLCEAFPSFREAACAAGCPAVVARMVPDVWRTEANVVELEVPVCVVHSDGDKLFPVAMAERIAKACEGELIVARGFAHNEPYMRPKEEYWARVVERMRGSLPEERNVRTGEYRGSSLRSE